MLLYFVILSEVVSIFLIFRIWKSRDYMILKVLLFVVVLIPFVGPIFYFIGSDGTPRLRDNLNASRRLFGRGRYTEWWDEEKNHMHKKIKELKEKDDDQ